MKQKHFTPGMFVLLCALTVVGETKTADFNGNWVLDESQSEGVPAATRQTMSITQSGEHLFVETQVYPSNGVAYAVKETYVLNGRETAFAPQVNGREGSGRRTSRWSADRQSIEVLESVTFDTERGRVSAQTNRKLALSADGQTITIESVSRTAKGNVSTKRVFVRQYLK